MAHATNKTAEATKKATDSGLTTNMGNSTATIATSLQARRTVPLYAEPACDTRLQRAGRQMD
jgi:hypothetical protein